MSNNRLIGGGKIVFAIIENLQTFRAARIGFC